MKLNRRKRATLGNLVTYLALLMAVGAYSITSSAINHKDDPALSMSRTAQGSPATLSAVRS